MEYIEGRLYMSQNKKGPSNTLGDLNNFLFGQLERLDNPDLEGDELLKEIARSKAISEIAKNVIENANVILQAQKYKDDFYGIGNVDTEMPRMLEG